MSEHPTRPTTICQGTPGHMALALDKQHHITKQKQNHKKTKNQQYFEEILSKGTSMHQVPEWLDHTGRTLNTRDTKLEPALDRVPANIENTRPASSRNFTLVPEDMPTQDHKYDL